MYSKIYAEMETFFYDSHSLALEFEKYLFQMIAIQTSVKAYQVLLMYIYIHIFSSLHGLVSRYNSHRHPNFLRACAKLEYLLLSIYPGFLFHLFLHTSTMFYFLQLFI